MRSKAEDRALESVRAFAQAHDPDPAHSAQVCDRSVDLFDALANLHGLGQRERLLLKAAALMHDTGYDTDPMQHHKGSRDLILDAKLDGFTRREVMMMACVARYHRKGDPDPAHKVYRDLNEEEQSAVAKLAAILRVADGLDRSHEMSAKALRVERRGDTVRVYVQQRAPNPIDISVGMRKSALFEKVFAVKLEIIAESL